jgi:hypothetical protein
MAAVTVRGKRQLSASEAALHSLLEQPTASAPQENRPHSPRDPSRSTAPATKREFHQTKKEEFTGRMETCCLGTPFPRSALFLLTGLWKTPNVTRVLKANGCK